MKIFIHFVLISIFLKFSTAELGLEYIPPSREVDIIEKGEYTFGVKEDGVSTNITRCYYSTDTNIIGSFTVAKYAPKPEEKFNSTLRNVRVDYNEITHSGNAGNCRMTIKWVDDTGPTSWKLTPFSKLATEEKGKNLTTISYKVNFFYKVPLIKETISIYESESFFQYLNATDKKFRSCKLAYRDTEVDLDMHSTKANIFLSPFSLKNEIAARKLSSLGHGLCGFKFVGVTKEDAHQWTLTGTDDQGKRYRAVFKTVVFNNIDPKVLNTKKEVVMGKSVTILCGEEHDQKFCSMYNPAGMLVYTESINVCKYYIKTVGVDDIGVWKCITGNTKTMESVNYTVQLIQADVETVETWVNENDDYVTIGCRARNFQSSITYCNMIAPNQESFSLQPGSATSRYLSLGTDFKKSTCVMEIPKPLQDFENGFWRCEISIFSKPTGGFIKVGKAETPDYPKYLKMTTQLKRKFAIMCQVPFSSSYCHITAPNGTQFLGSSEGEARLGMCTLQIEEVTSFDNGTWTCSFAQDIGVLDEEITVEVIVAEILTYYKNAEVYVGETAQLMCSTAGLPLKYCRYISPSGKAYHIPNKHTSDTISYSGRGLEYGDCGISISKAEVKHTGEWTCVTQIGPDFNKNAEISAKIMLEVTPNLLSDPNIAAAIGIAVGVVVISSIVGVVALRKWRRRSHAEVPGTSTIPRCVINDDNNSETDVFNMGPPPRSYTNPTTLPDDPHEHQL